VNNAFSFSSSKRVGSGCTHFTLVVTFSLHVMVGVIRESEDEGGSAAYFSCQDVSPHSYWQWQPVADTHPTLIIAWTHSTSRGHGQVPVSGLLNLGVIKMLEANKLSNMYWFRSRGIVSAKDFHTWVWGVRLSKLET
jgi:hypothetical protein